MIPKKWFVSFVEDFALSLSLLLKGSLDDKLQWTFHLYDLDGDGVIHLGEMNIVLQSVYEMLDISDGNNKAKVLFDKMDTNRDGVVGQQEFFFVCEEAENRAIF